jgi:hypothetical protein
MSKFTGVWVDHQKAYVVSIIEGKESIDLIESNMEEHIRLSGGSRSRTSFGPQDVAKEKKTDQRRNHQLRRYYRAIIRSMDGADKILKPP